MTVGVSETLMGGPVAPARCGRLQAGTCQLPANTAGRMEGTHSPRARSARDCSVMRGNGAGDLGAAHAYVWTHGKRGMARGKRAVLCHEACAELGQGLHNDPASCECKGKAHS